MVPLPERSHKCEVPRRVSLESPTVCSNWEVDAPSESEVRTTCQKNGRRAKSESGVRAFALKGKATGYRGIGSHLKMLKARRVSRRRSKEQPPRSPTSRPSTSSSTRSLSPHGGARPVHQKSTCLTQLTLGPYVVRIWSRYPSNLEGTKSS